jgi:hypothetical protein
MKIKLLIAAIAAAVLSGCVVVPEGHGHGGWHDRGYHGHRHWDRESHRW